MKRNTTLLSGSIDDYTVENSTIANSALNDSTANNVNLTHSDLKDSHIENATITGHLLPTANEQYDLGAPDMRFKDLYLSGSSMEAGTELLKVQDAIGTFEMSRLLGDDYYVSNLVSNFSEANVAHLVTANVTNLNVIKMQLLIIQQQIHSLLEQKTQQYQNVDTLNATTAIIERLQQFRSQTANMI